MNRPRLSICIPTYNFGRFIGETLDSILPQATEEVEVTVVDGASTDNTADIVGERVRRWRNLSYHRLDRRGGIDVDMALAVSLARGNYCWLFSADDVMLEGTVPRILREITEGHDIYLCGFPICTIDMVPLYQHPILNCGDAIFDLSNEKERKRYFSLAQTTTAFFSYMSSLVIKKTRWDEAVAEPDPRWQCWDHVGRIFRMMPHGLKVKYLSGSYLKNRGGNDSFMDRGIVHRIGISIEGFGNLANVFFGKDSTEAWHIRRVLKNEYTLRYILYAKLNVKDLHRDDILRLDALVAKIYQDGSLRDHAEHFLYRVVTPSRLTSLQAAVRSLRSFFR